MKRLISAIERLAIQFLSRRGHIVVHPPFTGLVIGNGSATQCATGEANVQRYVVTFPARGEIYAINNSHIDRMCH